MAHTGLDPELARRADREASLLRPTRLTTDSVAWGRGPAHDKYWIPEELGPLWESPEYAALTEEQKRRYNQYYACQKTEQFIWLERYFVIKPVEKLLSGEIPNPSLRKLLESFVGDERAHNAALAHLLRLSRPDHYNGRTFFLFRPSARFRFATAAITALPRLFSSWILYVGAIEESTIAASQCYRKAGDAVDPLFAEVYLFHAQDEARHCKLDTLFAEWLAPDADDWKKPVNAKLLDLVFDAYFDPRWGCNEPIHQLVSDFPELRSREAAMIRRTEEVRAPSFAKMLVDAEIAPMTAKNAERFDMLGHAIRRLFAASEPRGRETANEQSRHG